MLSARNKTTTFLLFCATLLACQDPCKQSLPASTVVGDGLASLQLSIVEQEGPSRTGQPLGCVRVFVVDSKSYADTLFNELVQVQEHRIHLQGFDSSRVDIVLDRLGFFPTKYVDVALQQGRNTLDERVLLYRSDVPFVIPGELGFSLRDGATLENVKSLYATTEGVTLQRAPGGYELKIPFRGTRLTREHVEVLSRRLIYSEHITNVSPLVHFSTVVPGF